jgi:NADPH-dependent glutamate synthase beta subunit-like oxidoreductase
MKSCIYQKTDPVDIPQAETRILKDVLALPWGFEIYSLLTRWNPLNVRHPVPLAATGKRTLVVGMGPAGFTLAHYLLNDGHTVVGIDGLKIEPLPPPLSGVAATGERVPFEPSSTLPMLNDPLDDRVMAGFGGVAEYGITVRWDKNFLKIIRLLLERRGRFALFGGVRFGGTLDTDGAFGLGFDHVALAAGAGRPTVLELPNGLATGVRTASDFLMALQLTGAAKSNSVANMQLRLPVVVVGGGLTAIDTATEALAYYPVQVEKFLLRYETLVAEKGESAVEAAWTALEREIAAEFLAHARAIRANAPPPSREGRAARIVELLQAWGGATIAYRRRLIDSPSYTLNHEEVEKALEEGIRFAEGLTPVAVEVDAHGHACALEVTQHHKDGDGVWHEFGRFETAGPDDPRRAGTQPNTVLAREDAAHFQLDGKYFRLLDEEGQLVTPVKGLAKPPQPAVLTELRADGRAMSFFGDLHPSFHGNVVKAMASATQGYASSRAFSPRSRPRARERRGVPATPQRRASGRPVVRVERLTPTIVEVGGPRPGRGAPLSPRAVLPPAEFRVAGARRPRYAPCDGRARAHGSVGRRRAGARVDDRAGNGRLVRPLHADAARRTRGADGTDRHADGNRRWTNRRAGRRRSRQCRVVLDRPGVPARGIEGAVFRRLQEADRSLQDRGDRSCRRCRRMVLRRGAGLRADAAAGSRLRRKHRRGDDGLRFGRAGAQAVRLPRATG